MSALQQDPNGKPGHLVRERPADTFVMLAKSVGQRALGRLNKLARFIISSCLNAISARRDCRTTRVVMPGHR
jgi:hypothetical protein